LMHSLMLLIAKDKFGSGAGEGKSPYGVVKLGLGGRERWEMPMTKNALSVVRNVLYSLNWGGRGRPRERVYKIGGEHLKSYYRRVAELPVPSEWRRPV